MQWWHLHKFPRGGHDKANRFGALARDSDVKVLGNPLRTWMMWRVILLHLNLGQKILNVIVMNDNLSITEAQLVCGFLRLASARSVNSWSNLVVLSPLACCGHSVYL